MPELQAAALGRRLDRMPWTPRHTRITLALGAGWLFDSLEVNLVGGVINPMERYFHIGPLVAQFVFFSWLVGILLGAVAGGHLADRFGRRRMFVLTLLWYACLTVLTGLAPVIWAVIVLRFLTGIGVGAEYPIINAAIIEMIPAKHRGKIGAAVMNFWPLGGAASGLLSYFLLSTLGLDDRISWRLGFAAGGVIALVVLLMRRGLPESPRWLMSQGRGADAEAIVAELEQHADVIESARVAEPAAAQAPAVQETGERKSRVRELFTRYRGRLILGGLLDLSEAFGYYGISALVTLVVFPGAHVPDSEIPFYLVLGNVGALAGGLTMTAWFDRLGRRRTVITTYLLAAAGIGVLALATASGQASSVLIAYIAANAFGTAAWTSAYPTFTELFPTPLRAVGVGASVGVGRVGAAFSVLIVTSAATGVSVTFGYLLVVLFWLVGAVAMLVFLLRGGVEAARRPLDVVSGLPAPEPAATAARA
jgi:MFS family permease